MPEIALFCVLMFGLVLQLILLDEQQYFLSGILGTLQLISLILLVGFMFSAPYETGNIVTVKVVTIDDKDVISVNNSIVNLNRLYGKDFEEGDTLTLSEISAGPYFGIVYDSRSNTPYKISGKNVEDKYLRLD